jgi:hypothetical protein
LCAITVSVPTSWIETRLREARRWPGWTSITSSSWPSDTVCSARSAGENVSTPKSMVRSSSAAGTTREGMRRTSIMICGWALPKVAITGSSEWTAASLAPTTTRPRRTSCSSRTACSASDASVSRRPA